MPIDLSRNKIEEKLSRLTYYKGKNLEEDLLRFLTENSHAFTADELVARIETAGNPIMLESVLTENALFSHQIKDDKVYWYVHSDDIDKALSRIELEYV